MPDTVQDSMRYLQSESCFHEMQLSRQSSENLHTSSSQHRDVCYVFINLYVICSIVFEEKQSDGLPASSKCMKISTHMGLLESLKKKFITLSLCKYIN